MRASLSGAGHRLDRSATMVGEAQRRLAPYAERAMVLRADLTKLLPLRSVDAIISTATYHWIHDHEALFAHLAAVLRPGGQLATYLRTVCLRPHLDRLPASEPKPCCKR